MPRFGRPDRAGRASGGAAACRPRPIRCRMAFVGWILGLAAVYGALFSAGGFVYGRPVQGTVWGLVAAGATVGLLAIGRRLWTASAGPAPAKS